MKKKSLYALPAVVLALILLASCTPRGNRPSDGSEEPSLSLTEEAAAFDTPSPTVLETLLPEQADDLSARLCAALLRGETFDKICDLSCNGPYLLEEEDGALGVYDYDADYDKTRFITTLPLELMERINEAEIEPRFGRFTVYTDGSYALVPFMQDDINDLFIWYADGSGIWHRMERCKEKVGGRGITGGCVIDENTAFVCYDLSSYDYEYETPEDMDVFDSCVYATFDGGSTWAPAEGAVFPDGLKQTFYYPIYLTPVFDGEHGVLPVFIACDLREGNEPGPDTPGCTVWFETTDGGRTWIFRDRCDGRAFG